MAKPMIGSHGSIAGDGSFLSALPPISYATVPVASLAFPRDLFDGTSAGPPAPLDPLLPIIAARCGTEGRLTIVDGCKRFRRLAEIGGDTCACGVFDGNLDEKRIGVLRIYLNRKRDLRIREKVLFFRWLARNFQGSGFEALLEPLGFPPSLRSELEPLLACSGVCLAAVDEGRIGVRGAAELCRWPVEDQRAFLESLRGLALSSQTQREFLEWLPEIAHERKTTVSEVLRSEEFLKTVKDEILNGPQKIEAVRALFHSWKFPLFDETLEQWRKTAAATSRSAVENEPSSKVVFMPAPAFEMNKLEIRITVSHAPAAGEIFRKLAEVPQSTWAHLIYPG